MDKKVLLMILDGWGIGKNDSTNAIYTAGQPNIDALIAKYPSSQLSASGEDVGLPEGQMGNSEVGHLNIGAGRVVYQDLVKINKACQNKTLLENKEVKAVYDYAKESGKALHFMGLLSNGGVHSSIEQLFAFLDVAKEYGLDKVYVHCFMDGRDTDPKSGKGFVEQLEAHMAKSTGKIASVVGRFYAMDRDKRWDRVKVAYDLMVNGDGEVVSSPVAAVEASYAAGVTDEFIKPIKVEGTANVEADDAVIFFNFRNDRAREITSVLTQEDMPEMGMKTLPLYYCCLTPYDDKFTGVHILFDKENVQLTLGEVVANAGKNQLRIAETEKYAHVTFFFNGGVEKENKLEDRILIPSPKVATYDLQPQMSAIEVTDRAVKEVGKYDVMILNFANCDMVGHTGVFDACVKAVETVDTCVKKVVDAILKVGGVALLTADHGNAEQMSFEDGSPCTSHTSNIVPFSIIGDDYKGSKLLNDRALCDIAPTMLEILGLQQPEEMTGISILDHTK